jgi:hypothetical protein
MNIKKNIIKFHKINTTERLVLFEAIFLFAWTIFLVKLLPLKFYHFFIGSYMKEAEISLNDYSEIDVEIISCAIRRARRIIPIKTKCLENSIVLKKMLDKRNIKNTLYLGLFKNEVKKLKAHAWVNFNNSINQNRNKYKFIACFS